MPQPLLVATSTDGGDTWTNKQVTSASNNPFNTKQGFGRSGCTVRTDSHGVVYVLANQFAVGTPGEGSQLLIKSFNGGETWSKPQNIGLSVDTCFAVSFDGASFRCVMDGIAGARDDLSSAPSIDIANGAPTGAGATNEIVRTWVDGRDGVNHEHVFTSYSTNAGGTWSAPASAESAGDRGYYSAIAISPAGRMRTSSTTRSQPRSEMTPPAHATLWASSSTPTSARTERPVPGGSCTGARAAIREAQPRTTSGSSSSATTSTPSQPTITAQQSGTTRATPPTAQQSTPGGPQPNPQSRTALPCPPHLRRNKPVRRRSGTPTSSAALTPTQPPRKHRQHAAEGRLAPPLPFLR